MSPSRAIPISRMAELKTAVGTLAILGCKTTVLPGVQTLVEVQNVYPTPRLFSKDKLHFRTVVLVIRQLRTMNGTFLQFTFCKTTPDSYVGLVTLAIRVAGIARWRSQK